MESSDVDEGDRVMNEGDQSSTTCVTKMVLTDSGVVREGVGWFSVDLSLNSCKQAIRMFFEWRREDNSCMQCMIPFQLDCIMAPEVSWV